MRRPPPDPNAPPAPDAYRRLPDRGQRLTLAAMIVIASVAILAQLWRRPATFADPPPAVAARAGEVMDSIDPNGATAAQLAELPGIGPAKAGDIVAYRASVDAPAFASPGDLARIRGIGPVTVEKTAPFLHFPPRP